MSRGLRAFQIDEYLTKKIIQDLVIECASSTQAVIKDGSIAGADDGSDHAVLHRWSQLVRDGGYLVCHLDRRVAVDAAVCRAGDASSWWRCVALVEPDPTVSGFQGAVIGRL